MILKNIFQLYTLFICLITTIILIITTSLLLNSITDLVIPQYKHYAALVKYESRDKYIRYLETYKGPEDKTYAHIMQLSPDQIDEKRIHARQEYLEEQKGAAIESVILYLQWILVAFVFFFIHWRFYKQSQNNL